MAPPKTKICSICRLEKPRDKFSSKGGKHDARRSYCYRCEKHKKHGVPVEQLTAIARRLQDPCDICGAEATDIDHDHETLDIRGVLCRRCNAGLGFFKSVDLLQRAIGYLLADPHPVDHEGR